MNIVAILESLMKYRKLVVEARFILVDALNVLRAHPENAELCFKLEQFLKESVLTESNKPDSIKL